MKYETTPRDLEAIARALAGAYIEAIQDAAEMERDGAPELAAQHRADAAHLKKINASILAILPTQEPTR